MSDRIFITGATGAVGQHLVPGLVALGHRITAVGRTAERRAQLEKQGATSIPLDLCNRSAVDSALQGQDVVINLATHMPASSVRMMFPWSWKENDRLRRDASAILSAAASEAGVRRFIQESFAPVYADGGDRWIDERWAQSPTSNSRSVLDAERSANDFTRRGGIGIVLRFANFYGPDHFLNEMIGMVRRGWSPLPGHAPAFFSSVAQEDAARAVIAALGVQAGAYNVGDDEPLTRREWADSIAAAIGARPPRLMPVWMTATMGSAMRLLGRSQRMSNTKLKDHTAWSPRWPNAREGLRAAAAALNGRAS